MPSPNEEQSHILDVARKGDTQILAINALAGTGKTTTLTMLADVYGPYAGRDIKYFTFNAHAAADAKKRFGRNVEASTAHSFAFRSSYPGTNLTMREVFANRLVDHGLFSPLMQYAKEHEPLERMFYNAAKLFNISANGWKQGISLVLQVLESFYKSADKAVCLDNVPDSLKAFAAKCHATGSLGKLVSLADQLWQMQIDVNSDVPVSHGVYLKLASMYPDPMNVQTVFFDEAQDASAPMLEILKSHIAQGGELVMVGDRYQHIYEWAGAMNAITAVAEEYADRSLILPLCQSYRFGQEIADSGNLYLRAMGASYQLQGMGKSGRITYDDAQADVTLFRSNFSMLTAVLSTLKENSTAKIHIVKGVSDLVSLLYDLRSLYYGSPVSPGSELAGFESWDELVEFSSTSIGSEYAPLVGLVMYKKAAIQDYINGLNLMKKVKESNADIIFSTAHKAKGAEYQRVRLALDFHRAWDNAIAPPEAKHLQSVVLMPPEEELALQYVAATRAKEVLAHQGLLSKAATHLLALKSLAS